MNKLKQILAAVGQALKKFFAAVWKFMKSHKVWTIIIILVLILALLIINGNRKRKEFMKNAGSAEITVERRDLKSSVTGSSVVEPNAEYAITPLVTGEILEAPFEEGDYVEKGQLMYRIDASTVETSLSSANIAIQKAQQAYNDAVSSHSSQTLSNSVKSADLAVQKAQQSYQDALENQKDLSVRAGTDGRITEVYVKQGDSVNSGTKIADLVNDTYMKIRVPFNDADAARISSGMTAELTLVGTGTRISGTVTAVSSASESAAGHMLVRYVSISAENPGALSAGDSATAMIGDIACNDVGTFEPADSVSITAKASGTLSSLQIEAGDRVWADTIIALLDSQTLDSQVTSAEISVRDAELSRERSKLQQADDSTDSSIRSAKLALDDAILARDKIVKQLEDYNITAPISGTIVTKNKKAGDKLESGGMSSASAASASSASASSASSGSLAVIYDMSSLCFDLNIDELDVKQIHVGQAVTITADASDKTYTGRVENVSVNGTAGTNGVTTYPVKIRILDFDSNLLPGMNIEAEISISQVSDALTIPVSALNRGDIVYVKGEKTDPSDKAPEGFHSVEVKTGISDEDYVQITSGLNEGDVVYAQQTSRDILSPEMMMQQEMHAAGGGNGGPPSGGGAPPSGGGGGGR